MGSRLFDTWDLGYLIHGISAIRLDGTNEYSLLPLGFQNTWAHYPLPLYGALSIFSLRNHTEKLLRALYRGSTYYLLPTTYYFLLTTHCIPPTTNY